MTKIAIISDTHFGYARGTERENDCWEAAEEAFRRSEDCDLIILPGDIFDGRIPRPEDWAKSIKILSKVRVPVVAIHGTHERRGRGLINPIEGLDHAGFLKHLHCSHETYEINGDKIAVFGMSGVPESYAKEVLENWDPKPKEGFYNIFIIHQSITPYIYSPNNPPSLRLDDLPPGFDLYISGHIHWPEKNKVHGKTFLIPGSTITTQIKKRESGKNKGFYVVDLEKNEINFVELDSPRKVFYKEFEVNHDKASEIEDKIENYLSQIDEKKKPLVRVIIRGNKKKGTNFDFTELKEKYRKKMILSLVSKVSEEEMEDKIRLLRDIKEKRMSVEEMGMKILKENLDELGSRINYDDLFEVLVSGNTDTALTYLLSKLDKIDESNEKETKIKNVNKTETKDRENSKGLERWLK